MQNTLKTDRQWVVCTSEVDGDNGGGGDGGGGVGVNSPVYCIYIRVEMIIMCVLGYVYSRTSHVFKTRRRSCDEIDKRLTGGTGFPENMVIHGCA